MRIYKECVPGEEMGWIGVEVLNGRSMWLWKIRHVLEKTAKVLYNHKWTILRPPEGYTWFTSDNPVVRLNYLSYDNYNFNGGWGNPGTEIVFPLGPHHLLYTQIGKRPPMRGTRVSTAMAEMVQRIIAEHAHRYIFSEKLDDEVARLRPRIVDSAAFHYEKEHWDKWHYQQTEAEREFLERNK